MAVVDPDIRIHRLPDNLVNRIAAGEVIERPASVVKELLENSLDAGADRITVEIESGGSRLIRVMDNGRGIHADDLPLAIERHTTSKLLADSDLSAIATLGFRGETLSSIAAVSIFSVTSRRSGQDYARTLQLESNGKPVIQPAAHPVGTTVEVNQLFYNTPARKKFLRSEKTEYLHILELVKRVAMSRLDLSLRLLHNQRQVFATSSSDQTPEQRIQQVLGKAFYQHAVPVNQTAGDLSLLGWIGLPDAARSQTDQQYIYLNGRIIRDRMLQHAVRSAYQDRIYPGKYPAYVLYLQTALRDVDVNVHPAKYEVRFKETRQVFDFLQAVITRAINVTATGVLQKDTFNGKEPIVIAEATSIYKDKLKQSGSGGGKTLVIGDRYLLVNDQGLVLIDMPVALELVMKLRLSEQEQHSGIRSRPVLVPLSATFSESDIELLDQNKMLLQSLGIEFEQSAPDTVMIKGLPVPLANADALALINDVVTTLNRCKDTAKLMDSLLDACASHANDTGVPLTEKQSLQLVEELKNIEGKINPRNFRRACRHFDLQSLKDLL